MEIWWQTKAIAGQGQRASPISVEEKVLEATQLWVPDTIASASWVLRTDVPPATSPRVSVVEPRSWRLGRTPFQRWGHGCKLFPHVVQGLDGIRRLFEATIPKKLRIKDNFERHIFLESSQEPIWVLLQFYIPDADNIHLCTACVHAQGCWQLAMLPWDACGLLPFPVRLSSLVSWLPRVQPGCQPQAPLHPVPKLILSKPCRTPEPAPHGGF